MTDDAAVVDDPRIADRALRSALEFAVGIAAAGVRTDPPLPSPKGLRPFLHVERLPAQGLKAVRAAVDGDPVFRRRLASVAPEDLVDEVGRLWLGRPDGWAARIDELLAPVDPQPAAAGAARERKRREAAEALVERLRAELRDARAAIDRLRTAADASAVLESESSRVREQRREFERALERVKAERDAAAAERDVLRRELDLQRTALAAAEAARDAHRARVDDIDAARLALSAAGDAVASALAALAPQRASAERASSTGTAQRRAGRRTPLAIPGGLAGDSPQTAAHLLAHQGVQVLVDGYNVGLRLWSGLPLATVRDRVVAIAERVNQRFGAAVTVVFDGDGTVAQGARRRVRVAFSPAGVSADDQLRAEVAALPVAVAVVVVTNDRAIVDDVTAMGANVLPSEVFADAGS